MASFIASMSARARLVTAAGVLLASVFVCSSAGAEETGSAVPGPDRVAEGGGLRVYVDPDTGDYTAPPADSSVATATVAGGARGARGVVKGDSPVPGGGQTIDVSGRYMFALRAGAGPDGQTVVGCDRAPMAMDGAE